MADQKRPPLPNVVHVAWFWCPTTGGWSVEYTDPDPKVLRGLMKGTERRHRFATYRIVARAVKPKRGR